MAYTGIVTGSVESIAASSVDHAWPPAANERAGHGLCAQFRAPAGYDIVAAARRAGARFSITARLTPAVVKAITGIDEQAWTPIRYPNAIYDEDEQRWVSDAEVAETVLTAFTGRRQREHVTARLIVRRVRRLNPATVPPGQTEAFAVYRYHAVFTDTRRADAGRRGHPPRPRHRRAGHRRAEERPARAPALGGVHRERRLAGLRRHRAQPHPRRRRPRRRPPRPHPNRDHPPQLIHTPARLAHSAHQPAPAPTPGLALGGGAGRTVPPRPARPPPHPRLTTARTGPTGDHQWNSRTDRQLNHAPRTTPSNKIDKPTRKIDGGSRLSRSYWSDAVSMTNRYFTSFFSIRS